MLRRILQCTKLTPPAVGMQNGQPKLCNTSLNMCTFSTNNSEEQGKESLLAKNLSSSKYDLDSKKAELEQFKNSEQDLEEQINEQMLARMNHLEKLHHQTQEMIDKKLKFPVKLCGTKDRYASRFGYLPERIFSYYRIPKSRVNDYLLKMFKASLYAIADRNTQYMDEYWEKGLKEATLQTIDNARSKNFKISVEKDENLLEDIGESCQIIDSVMFRGLSLDRDQNQNPSQYVKYVEPDEVGLITYTPKNLTQNNETFIDPKKNKTAYDGYQRMLLRTLVRIKCPLKLNISQFNIPEEVYTWEHLCVVENQMVAPKHLESSYKLETFIQWMGKYRFGPWKIVDIDNFMRGNSPFRNSQKEDQEELDPIFKGTKLDKSHHIDIRMI